MAWGLAKGEGDMTCVLSRCHPSLNDSFVTCLALYVKQVPLLNVFVGVTHTCVLLFWMEHGALPCLYTLAINEPTKQSVSCLMKPLTFSGPSFPVCKRIAHE